MLHCSASRALAAALYQALPLASASYPSKLTCPKIAEREDDCAYPAVCILFSQVNTQRTADLRCPTSEQLAKELHQHAASVAQVVTDVMEVADACSAVSLDIILDSHLHPQQSLLQAGYAVAEVVSVIAGNPEHGSCLDHACTLSRMRHTS